MTAQPTLPLISGLHAIAGRYEVALCDVWGVLHAGVQAFPQAIDAMQRFRQTGGTLILVSNAPRPCLSVVPQLDQLGVPRTAWDGIVTSGDVTRSLLLAKPDRPYFWIGPERDGHLFEGLPASVTALDEAELIVCTGLLDDTHETPADYAQILQDARSRDLPFLCANPDLVVDRAGSLIYCAGAIGKAYEDLGGTVIYAGKPDRPIYTCALDLAASRRRACVPLSRVLAIGDALRTDIAGARGLGCDSLFIAHGIHAHELGLHDGPLTAHALAGLVGSTGPAPDYALDRLIW